MKAAIGKRFSEILFHTKLRTLSFFIANIQINYYIYSTEYQTYLLNKRHSLGFPKLRVAGSNLVFRSFF